METLQWRVVHVDNVVVKRGEGYKSSRMLPRTCRINCRELKRQKSTAIVDKVDSLVVAFFTEKIQRSVIPYKIVPRSHGSHMSKENGCSLTKSLHFPTTDHPLDSA